MAPFSEIKTQVEIFLKGYLGELEARCDQDGSRELAKTIEYSLSSGGQRVRPILAILTAQCLRAESEKVMPFAAASELIHTYSLIHDDLPCMDDDDLRRGKPTAHKVFGEALALLAGDVLQVEALRLLISSYSNDPALVLEIVASFTGFCGTSGLVGGQAADLALRDGPPTAAAIEKMHARKTSSLFRFCVAGSAAICSASQANRKSLDLFAECFGQIFQIADDFSDVKKSEPNLVADLGSDQALKRVRELKNAANQALEDFGSPADGLRKLLDEVYLKAESLQVHA